MKTIMAFNLKQGDVWRWNDRCPPSLILSPPIRRKGHYTGAYRRRASTMYVIWAPALGITQISFSAVSQVQRL